MGGLCGDDELNEGHLLRTHQIHWRQVFYELIHFFREWKFGSGSEKTVLLCFWFCLFEFEECCFGSLDRKTLFQFPFGNCHCIRNGKFTLVPLNLMRQNENIFWLIIPKCNWLFCILSNKKKKVHVLLYR